MRDTNKKFSGLTIILHWIIAIIFIGLIFIEMDYPIIHKSLGLLVIIPVLIRIIWRIINGWPKPSKQSNLFERILAKLSHWILIIGTLLLPISGMLISGAGGYGIDIFGFEILAINHDPNDRYAVIPLNENAAYLGKISHNLVGNIMIVVISLHILGALKHHFIYKDNTLRRMFNVKK